MATSDIDYWNRDHEDRQGLIDKDHSQYSIATEALFPRNSFIADLGGGTGADSMYFLQRGHSVVVFDISPIALDFARHRAARLGFAADIQCKQVDLKENSIPSGASQFDVVYARLSLHYFTFNRTVEIFREVDRILKPGGRAFMTFKSPSDDPEIMALKKRATETEPNVFLDDDMIKSRFTVEQLQEILKLAGLSNFTVGEIREKLVGRGQTTRTGTNEFLLNEVVLNK